MRRGAVAALITASALIGGACASFGAGSNDATDGGAGEASTVQDGAGGGTCTRIATGFDEEIALAGFTDESTAGSIGWTNADGAPDAGALEARTTGQGQAQLARSFDGRPKSARVSFAAKLIAAPDDVHATYGCSLQLLLEGKAAAGNDHFIELHLEKENDGDPIEIDVNANVDASRSGVPASVVVGEFVSVIFEMVEINEGSVLLRASVRGQQVPIHEPRIALPMRPAGFRVKCGIDAASGAGVHAVVDDVAVEVCME